MLSIEIINLRIYSYTEIIAEPSQSLFYNVDKSTDVAIRTLVIKDVNPVLESTPPRTVWQFRVGSISGCVILSLDLIMVHTASSTENCL